jgi:hypothetical protein
MLRFLLLAGAATLSLSDLAFAREPESVRTIQLLEEGIQNKAPATYFALATELFRNNQKDEAAFWYFVGDVRYRASILAKAQGTDASEEQYHFWFVSQSVGQAIFESANHHPSVLVKAIERALAWDQEQPNGYTSKVQFGSEYERARQELLALEQRIKEGKAPAPAKRSSGRGLLSW